MSQSVWPTFERPPSVAFVDVDGTLLAQTTTYLFARILYRRGLLRRSFFLRALYHGLQHRFGRLDYGRLIGIGLNQIARIPVVELERIAYENFAEYVRPRLYEGVVEHMYALRRGRDADRAGLVVAGTGDRATQHLSGMHDHADNPCGDRARPDRENGFGPGLLRRRQAILGRAVGVVAWHHDGRRRGLRGQLERPGLAGTSRPGGGRPPAWPFAPARPGTRVGYRATAPAKWRKSSSGYGVKAKARPSIVRR